MKKLIVIAILAFLGWQGYTKHQANQLALANTQDTSEVSDAVHSRRAQKDSNSLGSYSCDGRTYCSQMTSCQEATFFLNHYPGVKMDQRNIGNP